MRSLALLPELTVAEMALWMAILLSVATLLFLIPYLLRAVGESRARPEGSVGRVLRSRLAREIIAGVIAMPLLGAAINILRGASAVQWWAMMITMIVCGVALGFYLYLYDKRHSLE